MKGNPSPTTNPGGAMTPRIRTLLGSGVAAAIAGLFLAACADGPTATDHSPFPEEPQLLINGSDDFDRTAVAAIMVYQPDHPGKPGWRSFCTATLIHKRVLTTAGPCIEFLGRQMAAGIIEAVWISFQHDPLAHFDTPPTEADPASGGWYAIESLHNNPANPGFVSPAPPLEPGWPDTHDSGAIILKDRVKGIQPMKMPSRPGEVEARLARAGCVEGADCGLVAIGYGLMEFPPPFMPLQTRQSAPLLYNTVDFRWVRTFQAPPGSEFGATCFGDSGGPIVLLKDNGRDRIITAMVTGPDDPFAFPCTGGMVNYRVDTEEHLHFIKEVILQSLRGSPN
jgi:hypothetical protein